MAQRSPILIVVLLAILAGYALGGRLRRFESLRMHWWALAVVGVALQALQLPSAGRLDPDVVGVLTLVSSYVLLLAFLAANRWVPASRAMALGLLLNLAVVSFNAGMPVSGWAIQQAGDLATGEAPIVETSPKHHLMTEEDVLAPLGDTIPIPPPIGIVLSIGDVFLYAGMAWFIIQVMRGRSRANPRPFAVWFLAYRGKHAPGHWRMPARYRTSAHAEVGQSGIWP